MTRVRLTLLTIALVMLCLATPALATGGGTASVCPPPIDFEEDTAGSSLYAGQPVDGLAGLLASGVTVTTGDAAHPAMIFDSASPTGGDDDLGTPNQSFGGPGVGSGGTAGQAGQNALPLGKVLIISEDGINPDDNAGGGTLTFTFDRPVFVERVQVIDIDEGMAGDVTAFDGGGSVIGGAAMLNNRGNNSVQSVQLGASGVERLEIFFPGSGAVSEITFCDQSVCVPEIDFDARADGSALFAGDTIDGVAGAIAGATATSGDPSHKAMIFDSTIPTGGDDDLGTPNVDFGGPGIGAGGSASGAGPNVDAQGNVLIISEDNDTSDPDDNAGGGTLTLVFDEPTWIDSVDVLDIDCGETGGRIRALDAGGVVIASEPLADLCNNSFQTVSIGVGDVSSLEIDLPSSGALVRVRSCECSVNPIKLTFGKKQVRWVLKNVGADSVTIDQLSIEWPPINGNLRKIKLGRNTIWTGNLPPLSATLTVDDFDLIPHLNPGEKRPLRFIFKRAVDQTPELYTIRTDFAQGCFVEREGTQTVPECDIATAAALEFGTQQIRWQITNAGAQTVNIDGVTLEDWPVATNGDFIKLLLGSQNIADSGSADLPAAAPPVTVTDFNAATSLALAPGESKKLKLNFANPIDALGFYDLAVDITTEDELESCPVDIQQGDPGVCGDGTVDPGEDCDDGNADNTDACLDTCVAASCGDGFTQTGVEACDDGNADNTDACLDTCVAASCGDGFTQTGVEACDDGNADNTDACLDTCVAASCGDTFTWAGVEECDDGNTTSGDGCSDICMNEGPAATCPCGLNEFFMTDIDWSDDPFDTGFSPAGFLWEDAADGGFSTPPVLDCSNDDGADPNTWLVGDGLEMQQQATENSFNLASVKATATGWECAAESTAVGVAAATLTLADAAEAAACYVALKAGCP